MNAFAKAVLLVSLAVVCIGLVVSGAPILEVPLPGGLPLGNLVAALGLGGIAGAACMFAPQRGVLRRFTQWVFAASVTWLPVSIALAGNLSLNFEARRGDIWQAYTAGIAVISVLTLLVAVALRILRRRRSVGPA